jgi:hypothetical protein
MVMNSHDVALALGGVLGSGVALIHGALTQRLMVKPFQQLADSSISPSIRRLVPLLLHFSTFNWFIGGIALIAAAIFFQRQARIATGLLVGSSYLFGALGNLWGTRSFHPGWVLYGIALALIAYGVCGSDH